jgi:hypothetical protein
MEIIVSALVMLSFASRRSAAAELFLTPAFVWSEMRCVGVQDHRVNSASQTVESLLESVFYDFMNCSATQESSETKSNLEMIVAFVGKELRSEDISVRQYSGILKALQEFVANATYSLSIPYVTVGSDDASVLDYFLSNVHKATFQIGQLVISGSCLVERHDVMMLTDVTDIKAFIAGRKTSRMEGDTDVLVICYSPALVMNAAAISTVEGHVLDEVLSVMKSSLTSNVAMYFSDPTMPKENHTGSLNRHLLQVNETATPDCDTLCKRRAVILEGLFVVVFLIVVLASGLCCMKGVKAPTRFEVSKEQ